MPFRIDNADSRVSLDGQWNSVASEVLYHGDAWMTTKSGSRLSLRFTGTSIAVYGYLPPQIAGAPAPISYYYIDTNRLQATFQPQLASTGQPDVLYYRSPALSPGEHTLTIESAQEDALFAVDYFVVDAEPAPETGPSIPLGAIPPSSESLDPVPPGSILPSSITSVTTASPTWAGTVGLVMGAPVTVPDDAPGFSTLLNPGSPLDFTAAAAQVGSTSEGGKRMPAGAIVGAVLGILGSIALVVVVLLLLRKRRRKVEGGTRESKELGGGQERYGSMGRGTTRPSRTSSNSSPPPRNTHLVPYNTRTPATSPSPSLLTISPFGPINFRFSIDFTSSELSTNSGRISPFIATSNTRPGPATPTPTSTIPRSGSYIPTKMGSDVYPPPPPPPIPGDAAPESSTGARPPPRSANRQTVATLPRYDVAGASNVNVNDLGDPPPAYQPWPVSGGVGMGGVRAHCGAAPIGKTS